MTTTIIYSNSSDGYVGNTDPSYSTARDSATGDATSNNDTYLAKAIAGERDGTDGDFTFNRSFFDFTMPASGGIIQSATITLRLADLVNLIGFRIYSSIHSIPITTSDFDAFGDQWGENIAPIVGENSVTLNATALAAIDWGQTIKICVRERTNDAAGNIPPTNRSAGIYFSENGTVTSPKLEIVHAPRKMSPGIGSGSYLIF